MRRIEFESGIKLSYLLHKGSDKDHKELLDGSVLLARGRDAIKCIIDDMGLPKGSGVLLPTFACEEIYAPFIDAGFKIFYYRVHEDLTPDFSHILEMKDNCKVVFVINYFGFLQPASVYDQLKNWGLVAVEDGSHSFLSKGSGEHGEYYFASMRKLLPLLDGAILRKKDRTGFKTAELRRSRSLTILRISRVLGQMVKTSDNRRPRGIKQWFIREMFARAERELRMFPSPAAMSKLSINILSWLNLDSISAARRQNFTVLAESMAEHREYVPVYKSLPENVVPYGFPVFAVRRSVSVMALDNLGVQAAPLWGLSSSVPAAVLSGNDRIYRQSMLFPVGQDYNTDDMSDLIVRIKSLADGN